MEGSCGSCGAPLYFQGYLLGNESIQSCADAVPYCNSITKMPEFAVDGGNMATSTSRLLCPCDFLDIYYIKSLISGEHKVKDGKSMLQCTVYGGTSVNM